MLKKLSLLPELGGPLVVCLLSSLMMACAPGASGGDASQTSLSDKPQQKNPAIDPGLYDNYYPLSWEDPKANAKYASDARAWSDYAFHIIQNETPEMLTEVKDMDLFCPRYDSLSEDLKINAWGALFSGMSLYESGYSPVSRMQETTMGTDPITKQPVYSEGLLQLSYQDITGWPFCDFDWSQDKYLSPKDPNKTILDPYRNLECGIKIMAQQVHRKGRIALSSGVYWAVLKIDGKYGKVDSIAKIVKKTIPECN